MQTEEGMWKDAVQIGHVKRYSDLTLEITYKIMFIAVRKKKLFETMQYSIQTKRRKNCKIK